LPDAQNARCFLDTSSTARTSSGLDVSSPAWPVGSHPGTNGPHEFDCASIHPEFLAAHLIEATDSTVDAWRSPG
jgi:hypothetical protein